MAKGVYVGVGGSARKVKKIYVGVGGVAKKVKKVFVGVGGAPKLVFSGEVQFVGEITGLSVGRKQLGVSRNPSYGIFGGGRVSNATTPERAEVEAYNTSLVRSTSYLDTRLARPTGTSVGNYAILAGGYNTDDKPSSVGSAFDTSLSRASANLSTRRCMNAAGAYNSSYGLIGGGTTSILASSDTSTVDAFDSSLVRTSAPVLSTGKTVMGGGNVGQYAIFAGGTAYNSDYSNRYDVEAYDTSLVKTSASNVSVGGGQSFSISVGNKVMFAKILQATASVYDSSLVKTTLSIPTSIRFALDIANDVALLGDASTVYVYDNNLVLTQTLSATTEDTISSIMGTSVGEYGLISGFDYSSNNYPNVFAFQY